MSGRIKIYCNHYPGGWHPEEIETGLGGSEESLILFAEELVKFGFKISVFIPTKLNFKPTVINGVFYDDRSNADVQGDDIFITFKDPTPYRLGARGKLNFHLSCEVEKPWNVSMIDAFVHISDYHHSRHPWIPASKSKVIPLGIDTDFIINNFIDRDENQILYCSSPDRGLRQLLEDWGQIKKFYPYLKLKIAYGWKSYDDCTKGNSHASIFKNEIMKKIESLPGIEFVGTLTRAEICQEFWSSTFWVLPLQNPDSELFCLNAMKSRFVSTQCIVNKFGALQNTVGEYFDYQDFIQGKLILKGVEEEAYPFRSWGQVVQDFWLPLFENPNNPTRKETV